MGKCGGFQGLGLDASLLKGVLAMYSQPTPVQREVLPVALSGRDVACMARTGAGKTASFLIPVLQVVCQAFRADGNEDPVACILSPTRELALQTYRFASKMSKFCLGMDGRQFSQAALVGGEAVEAQFDTLSRRPATLIATPGRLAHLLQEAPLSLITLARCRVAVFDEADRLFEMGFALQLRLLLDAMPEITRQTLLFSATMPRLLAQFARAGLRDNVALVRLEAEARLSETLRLAFFTTRTAEKPAALCAAIRNIIPNSNELTIVFVATRHHCELILAVVTAAFPSQPAAAIYGAMDQEARTTHMRDFRRGVTRMLIVTDVAARGLDVPLVDNVINYHMAPASRLFVHRCGRAARQGRPGVALSLVDPEELPYMLDLHTLLDRVPADACGPQPQERQDDHTIKVSLPSALLSYTRAEGWTPDGIHYGNIRQASLDLEARTLAVASQNDGGVLVALTRVADNAMQQYRKTRPAASKRAATHAKILRLTELHPLFLGTIRSAISTDETASAHFMDRDNCVLRARLSSYRPNQSILEMKLTTAKDESACQEAAKVFRDAVIRKKALQDGRAKSQALALQAKEHGSNTAMNTVRLVEEPLDDTMVNEGTHDVRPKRRISKAERKVLKSGDKYDANQDQSSKLESFRADAYIEYGNTRAAEIDELLDDHRQKDDSASGAGTSMLESALLDIAPDDALDMIRKRSMYRWDSRKRKYIQSTVADLLDGTKQRGNKKLKTESGKTVSGAVAAASSGEMYRRWYDKNRRGATHTLDDAMQQHLERKCDHRSRAKVGKKKSKPAGSRISKVSNTPRPNNELKSAVQIAKQRKETVALNQKNMPRAKRRAFVFGKARGSTI